MQYIKTWTINPFIILIPKVSVFLLRSISLLFHLLLYLLVQVADCVGLKTTVGYCHSVQQNSTSCTKFFLGYFWPILPLSIEFMLPLLFMLLLLLAVQQNIFADLDLIKKCWDSNLKNP